MAKGIDDYLVIKEKENGRSVEDVLSDLKESATSFEEFVSPDHVDEIKRALSIVRLPEDKKITLVNILKERCRMNIDAWQSKFNDEMRCDINKWLTENPPKIKYIFKDVLVRGIVAGLMSKGGTGKSYLELYWAISCTTGQTLFDHFVPSESMKVIVLFGEDDEVIVWQRFQWIIDDLKKQGLSIDEDLLKKNLYCICGISAPLMHLDNGNPHTTETYTWLEGQVKDFRPSLIIVDPKTHWYGLEENSNDYNTQWVNCLKGLTHISGATILFSHHVTKQDGQSLGPTASRGGSALTDNCRWIANMRLMDKTQAKNFGISNPAKYVEFKVTKNNYAELMSGSLYFKKIENGLLKQVNLEMHKFVNITSILEDILRQEKVELTIDQLVNKAAGKKIRNRIKEEVGGKVTTKDIESAINNGINEGMFEIMIKSSGRRPANHLVLKENYQS